jgi:hypothetical protein
MKMKLRNIVAVTVASVAVAGCDLFAYDNLDPPTSVFSGQLEFNGEAVPMRGHVQSVRIWQIEPVFPTAETNSYEILVNQDGTFRGLLYDGTFEASIESTGGPFVPNNARTRFEMRGSYELNMPIVPYYTIEDETITYDRNAGVGGGAMTATFRVGQHDTSRLVDFVALYISLVNTVDHVNVFTIASSQIQRTRAQIQTQLDTNGLITITVNLPANVHQLPQPEPRKHVFVRVGVKPVGVTERVYTNVYRIDI